MWVEERYYWWDELVRARPRPQEDLEAAENITNFFADWHDRALNFDPLGRDPYALSELCVATGASAALYRDNFLLPEEEVSVAEDVRKFYIFPVMAKRLTFGLYFCTTRPIFLPEPNRAHFGGRSRYNVTWTKWGYASERSLFERSEYER